MVIKGPKDSLTRLSTSVLEMKPKRPLFALMPPPMIPTKDLFLTRFLSHSYAAVIPVVVVVADGSELVFDVTFVSCSMSET